MTADGETKDFRIAGRSVAPGERRDLVLPLSETYSGTSVGMPVRVLRGTKSGPALFVTAAVHGDEWNGTAIVRELLLSDLELAAGTLVCVPVVNVFGFETHSRVLPDRRDPNRAFPGRRDGNLAERFAYTVFEEIVAPCDYGIDLHTAPVRRTNLPSVRGDLDRPAVARLAEAFGTEVILHQKGAAGSLRRAACERDRPTILFEGGEALRFEPEVVATGVRGIRNVLRELGMIAGDPPPPGPRVRAYRSVWVRAARGGLLRFRVGSGSRVAPGEEIARCEDLFGAERERLQSPAAGVVIGMTTLPAVKPGEPVCHVAVVDDGRAG